MEGRNAWLKLTPDRLGRGGRPRPSRRRVARPRPRRSLPGRRRSHAAHGGAGEDGPGSLRGGPGAASARPFAALPPPVDYLPQGIQHRLRHAAFRQQSLLHLVVVEGDLLLGLGAEPRCELSHQLGASQPRPRPQAGQQRRPHAALALQRPLNALGHRRGRRGAQSRRIELAPGRGLEIGVDEAGQQFAIGAGEAREVGTRIGIAAVAVRLLVLAEQLVDVAHGSNPEYRRPPRAAP